MGTVQRWKGRKGGVYAWRTRSHERPRHREWGYVGETNSFARRERDHRGMTAYPQPNGTIIRSSEKPWMDLDPKVYRIIRLPWWACWKWVLRPLETLTILALAPRYNHKKNLWNPRRVPLSVQRAQRDARNYGIVFGRAPGGRRWVQVLGVACILAAILGAIVTR